jgi:hypothetical protein
MENNNKQIDEIAASSQKEGTQESPKLADRLNIDDINRRNAEKKKRKKIIIHYNRDSSRITYYSCNIFF